MIAKYGSLAPEDTHELTSIVGAISLAGYDDGRALEQLAAKLSQLSPLLILDRGYAIVSNDTGILKDAALAPAATGIHVRLAKGELDAAVLRRDR